MPLLDDAVLADSYDVVVVGSGLAGLTAAALIAQRGLRVLVLEHHYLPGGMCTTLRRQGFSFDTGTALLYGFGERGVNPHRFVMNALGADIDVIEHRALLRMRLPGKDSPGTGQGLPATGQGLPATGKQITFWPDYERFVEELAAAFPHQAGQVRALYTHLHKLYSDVIANQQLIVPPSEIPLSENLGKLLRHPITMLQSLRLLNTSAETVLSRYVTDPELRAFFDKLCSTYVYCTAAETPGILAATMFIDNHVGGAYYPARSPQILASTLERAIEDHGGQVLCGHRVEEIVIQDGAATGVRLAGGRFIPATRVVANVTVWNLYGRLIRQEHIPAGRRAWADSLVPTYPAVVLYIGVDAEAIPPDTMPVEMLVADLEGVNSGDVTVYISSLDDPSICPPGTHAITVIAPSTERWPGPDDPAYRSPAYAQQKQAAIERILLQIESHFPGFRAHIRMLEAGTPSTIERYTLKNGGAVGGPKQMIGQELMHRLHAHSEWRNLYLCGDSTVMGMGTPAVTVSGIGAANAVLQDAGLPPYRRQPPPREAVHRVQGRPLAPLPEPDAPIDRVSAVRLARECDYCESPGCTAACPARIDVRNVMRRIEAGNFAGAARQMREVNPLAEVCGYLCAGQAPCEARCNRRRYSPTPVRIADLQAWVCREAGAAGWSPALPGRQRARVAVAGAGPAGLSCAYYLAHLGCAVTLFDAGDAPGGWLLDKDQRALPAGALSRDLHGLLAFGISFQGDYALDCPCALTRLAGEYDAVAVGPEAEGVPAYTELSPLARAGGIWSSGKLFGLESTPNGQPSAVQAVAAGRRLAQAVLCAL
jgi:prolycopene isomerase